MQIDVLKRVLPEGLLEYFDIADFKELGDTTTAKDCYFIYLDEKNVLPSNYKSEEYESKGFNSKVKVQDFPIRGKAVYSLTFFFEGINDVE
ncbi:MAG: hypothetical protein K0B10_15140 [Vicingaceae bacterium]|nr:hypothetical protein [Vicingaceae bacterium]